MSRKLVNSIKIAIIQNNFSTQNKVNSDWLDKIICDYKWIKLFKSSNPEDINKNIIECKRMNIPTIAIDGGDGTAGIVFSCLINNYQNQELPLIALLPSGKTNMTSRSWGIKTSRVKALKILIKNQIDDQLQKSFTDNASLTVSRNGKPDIHGVFFGAANIVDSILFCRKYIYPLKLPNWISHTLALVAFIKKAFYQTGNKNIIKISEKNKLNKEIWKEDGNFFIIIATTLSELLFELKPKPKSGLGAINYLSLKHGIKSTLTLIPCIIKKDIKQNQSRTIKKSKCLMLKSINYFTLDGELYETTQDEIITLNADKSLRFIKWK